VTQKFIERFPKSKVYVTEPAERMLAIAKQNLSQFGDNILGYYMLPAEELELTEQVDVALCSAAMHLIESERAFNAVSNLLCSGGWFCFNLWYHSFDETANLPNSDIEINEGLMGIIEKEVHSKKPELKLTRKKPQKASHCLQSKKKFDEIGLKYGLKVINYCIDEDVESWSFSYEFREMGNNWLSSFLSINFEASLIDLDGFLDSKVIIEAAKKQTQGKTQIVRTIRFLVQKM